MTRIWQFSRQGNGSGPGIPPPGSPPVQLDRGPEDRTERYLVRPVRPVAQIATRVALWGAVAFGCLGGLFGVLRSSGDDPPPARAVVDDSVVPVQVAGMAERVVQEWLTATDADRDRMTDLFVEVPPIGNASGFELEVRNVTAVAGRRMADGYWAVTVAADVVDADPDAAASEAEEQIEAAAGGSAEEEQREREATWYLDVGIVGQPDGGLAALAAPAVMPGPEEAVPGWSIGEASVGDAVEGDPIVATVEGFLSALLTGERDPERYVAPGVEVRPTSPAPFVEVAVQDVSMEEMEDGRTWVLVQALGTTRGGVSQSFVYDLILQQRVDRWEIQTLSGVPTVLREATPDTPVTEPDSSSDTTEPEPSSDSTEPESSSDTTAPDGSSDTTAAESSPGTSEGETPRDAETGS